MSDLDKLDALAAAATPGPWLSERRLLDSFEFSGEVAAFIAACDPATIRDLVAAARRGEEAMQAALNELGVPDENYPAPVANAVDILRAALHSKDGASDE